MSEGKGQIDPRVASSKTIVTFCARLLESFCWASHERHSNQISCWLRKICFAGYSPQIWLARASNPTMAAHFKTKMADFLCDFEHGFLRLLCGFTHDHHVPQISCCQLYLALESDSGPQRPSKWQRKHPSSLLTWL